MMNIQRFLDRNPETEQQFRDELTGLYNLGLFQIVMEQEVKRCERQWESFALCLIDVDGLDNVNDTRGRAAGDAVMKEIASLITENIREVDLPFRCFDDAFAVVLIKTEADLAHIAAERIRRAIQSRFEGAPTVSLGLASFPRDGTTKEGLVSKAQEALDHAKTTGKNASFFFEFERPFDDDDKPTVLVVDDDERNAKLLEVYLTPLNCHVIKASRGAKALDIVRTIGVDIVLLDVMMPEMSGYEVCRRLKSVENTRLIPVVLVTALDDEESKVKGIELGADDFITKPVNREELLARTKSLVKMKLLNRNLTSTENVLFSLANAVEAKDSYTQGHTRRVSQLAASVGRNMGLSQRKVEALKIGGILHDVGKIGISTDILNKEGKLTDSEWRIMRSHPEQGHTICLPLERTLGTALEVVRHHHEKLDGSGYPDGLRGDSVSDVARIMAVVDIYDALVTDRPYRKSMSPVQAREILNDEVRNGKLDSAVVRKLIELVGSEETPGYREDESGPKRPEILIVEDNELNLKLVKTLVELEGYCLIPATDAESGLALAREKIPDLILMDIQLPGLNGLAATKIVKEDPEIAHIPVVAITSYAMQSDREEAVLAGCTDFITKPLDTKSFIPTIKKILGSRGAESS